MKPVNFKRLSLESPEKVNKRKMSDISLPPSFRM